MPAKKAPKIEVGSDEWIEMMNNPHKSEIEAFEKGEIKCAECGITLNDDNSDYNPDDPENTSPFCNKCLDALEAAENAC